MALGGYKRVARASFSQRQRVQKRSKTRHPEGQTLDCSRTSSNIVDKQKQSFVVTPTDPPLVATALQRREKRKLSSTEKEQFKDSESWNAEQQRLRNEENKRIKKRKKQQRRRERKKRSQTEPQAKLVETAEDTARVQKEGSALKASEAASVSDVQDLPSRVAEVDEGLKYDLAVKFGWIDPKEDNPGSIQDSFVDSAYEDDQPPQWPRMSTITDEHNALHETHPTLHQSPPIEHTPRTPTRSPRIHEPTTPTRPIRTPDVLVVTPSRRCPSPSFESIVSPKSSTTARVAASMLVTLKSRTARLNTQITGFNTHLLGLLNALALSDNARPKELVAKAAIVRKIVTAMEEHSNEVFVMERALRDLVDEGDEDLPKSLRETEGGFGQLVKLYEKKMQRLMRKLSPEALGKTLKDVETDRMGRCGILRDDNLLPASESSAVPASSI